MTVAEKLTGIRDLTMVAWLHHRVCIQDGMAVAEPILVGTLRGQFVNNKATMVFGSRNALGQFISWLEGVLEEDAPVYCEVSYGS